MNEITYKISKVKDILDIMETHGQIFFRGGTTLSLTFVEMEHHLKTFIFSSKTVSTALSFGIQFISAHKNICKYMGVPTGIKVMVIRMLSNGGYVRVTSTPLIKELFLTHE